MIEELLQCRCGHGISDHSATGCEGDRLRRCGCQHTRVDVLESAIHEVRTEIVPAAGPGQLPRYVTPT